MTRIIQLDPQTANSIAAGEVVERPSSVVKELVENALDAGSSVIVIDIMQGGIRSIRVTDNGSGMDADDAMLAFGRHATSKLRRIEDLDHLLTMGFRGEALASIAAVARVTLETREAESEQGTRLVMEAGVLLEQGFVGCPEGTSVLVEQLFANVPARFKFLRKDHTEAGHIAEMVERMALARPDVSFRLAHNNQELLHTPGNNDLTSAVYAVFGRQTAQAVLPVEATTEPLTLTGLVGRPEAARNNRSQQCLYVNGRPVRSRVMTAALDEAYKTRLLKGRKAVAVLFLNLPTQLVDVNVHPQKLEVRFWNDGDVFRCVYHAVQQALQSGGGIAAATEQDEAESGATHASAEQPDSETQTNQPALCLQEANDAVYETAPPDRKSDHDDFPSDDKTGKPGAGEQLPDAAPQQQALLQIGELSQARLIGTLFQTYVLLEAADDLLLVDQHAAHEKILFERLVARHRQARESGALLVQDLLVPAVVAVSRRDLQTVQAEAEQLRLLGFDCSPLDPTSVAVRSIPDTGERRLQAEAAFRLALAALQQDRLQTDDDLEAVFFQMACKAAVKAHDRLSHDEIRQLLLDLGRLKDPYHCPHGRPVVVRLTRRELEKRFRRIV